MVNSDGEVQKVYNVAGKQKLRDKLQKDVEKFLAKKKVKEIPLSPPSPILDMRGKPWKGKEL